MTGPATEVFSGEWPGLSNRMLGGMIALKFAVILRIATGDRRRFPDRISEKQFAIPRSLSILSLTGTMFAQSGRP